MYFEYERYLLNIRNSLIQNGIEFPEITKGSMSYYELFKLGIKLSDILLYYRVLAVSGSGDGLENFFLPINTSYVDKIRGICYSEFVSDVLPNYKKLSLGIEPEEDTDDVALEDVENTEEVESDFSEDLFNSMFEEDNTEEDVSDDTDDSIENDFDATIKQRLNENTEYVPNGVYLEEVPSEGYSDDVVYTDSGTFLDDESDMDESSYDEESEEGYSDESDTYEESDYSEDEDDYDESNYSDGEEEYEESDYSEDEEDYSESNYSDEEDYSESDYSEDDEDDYEESDYSVDDEDDYAESDYSEDEEDAYEESDYSEDEDDYAESDYSDDYEESDYSEDEDDYEESDYSQDEEDDYEESDYSEDDEEGTYSNSNVNSVKPKKTKDLGDEIQDITNTVLTGLKQKAINFLKKKE